MEDLAVLIPILALAIPVTAIVFNGLIKLAKARREGIGSDDVVARLAEVEGDVQELRRQLSETQERLDFAERLLAKPRDEPRR
jgi:hypothetical protein